MAYHILPLLTLFCSFLVFRIIAGGAEAGGVSGVYVFGDSLVDVGNNNYLSLSLAKADFPHNGIDYQAGRATGRFSNGKNAADFLAEKLGLTNSPPPYLSLVTKFKKLKANLSLDGVSFASGGAGILSDTDQLFKQSISLTIQVEYYSAVHDQLVQQLGAAGAEEQLSRSLFAIVIGSNDLFGYFKENSQVSRQMTPQQYVDLLLSTLEGLMQRLYTLGARKYVVAGIGLVGCCPAQRKENKTGNCQPEINYWATQYNTALKSLLGKFKLQNGGVNYSYFDTYSVMSSFLQNPSTYGFAEIKEACCGLGNLKADIPCIPISTFCTNRQDHLFWDLYHPTQAASRILADLIYSGTPPITIPINVEQLAAL